MKELHLLCQNIKNRIFNKYNAKTLAIYLFSLLIIFSLIASSYAKDVNEEISDKIIRLHVVANSDSEEDQQLKRKVRDKILQYMTPILSKSVSRAESIEILQTNLTKIIGIANKEILANGKTYKASAKIGEFPFPTKTYGDVALPAGSYEALRIQLGNGEGANWWCVMFPPLCFVDATHGTIPDYMKAKLKTTLSKDDYKLVTSNDELPVQLKFKIVEIYQGSKNYVAGLFSKLMKNA